MLTVAQSTLRTMLLFGQTSSRAVVRVAGRDGGTQLVWAAMGVMPTTAQQRVQQQRGRYQTGQEPMHDRDLATAKRQI